MKWRVVDKSKYSSPASGNYTKWKAQLADEGGSQCVYCCIHESAFGGSRNFHVEHYRPKSIFPELENEYKNLFYACGICNVFKSNDWPSDHKLGDYSKAAYPDPSKISYGDFIGIDGATGEVHSECFTGKYIIERLHLNRPQIVGLRAIKSIFAKLDSICGEIQELLQSGNLLEHQKDEIIGLLIMYCKLMTKFTNARPYGADQLRFDSKE